MNDKSVTELDRERRALETVAERKSRRFLDEIDIDKHGQD